MASRAQSNVNVIVYITLVIAALIIMTWYVMNVRPQRQIIGAALEDFDELRTHLTNACTVTLYRASYTLVSRGGGFVVANATHYCLETALFDRCLQAPCELADARIPFSDATLNITREEGGLVTIGPVLS